MPRLCVLTQYYPPEMGAPQARLSELAVRLRRRGWDVDVLTALPNYPTGQILDGYPRHRSFVEVIDEIRVVRTPLYPSKTGFAKRIATYLSFAATASALGPRHLPRPDVMWVESPPLFIAGAAWTLAARWGCPYVANVSDLWPESAIRMGVVEEGAATRAAEWLEQHFYRRARGITGQSDGILEGVRQRAPTIPRALITNGVDPSRFEEEPDATTRELMGDEDGPLFVYAGLLGYAQGLDQVLDLAARLRDTPCRFVLVGDGPCREELTARVAKEGLDNVRLTGGLPRERIPAVLACSDIALIPLGMSIPGAVPSKIYEAMAAGRPILLVADGEPERRVLEAGAGLTTPPGDLDALEAHARRLAEEPQLRRELGSRGRRAAETTYHRDRIADRLDGFLRSRLEA